ncbi:MAG: glycosyltransferase family 2 protein [Acidobacteriota bacterium]
MSTPTPISVLVTTLNEEERLAECLASVMWAEERLVVDSGSVDRTAEIALEHGARVIVHPYESPARQKNWGLTQCRHEWVLILDADEVVSPALAEELQALHSMGPRHDGHWIRRENVFMGKVMRYGGWESDRVIRFVQRDRARYDDRLVHEEIDLPGPLPTLRHPMRHHTFRSFQQYWPKVERYSVHGALDAFGRGKRANAWTVFSHAVGRFVRMYLLRRGFLDGGHGLVLALFSTFTTYLKYARLWELSLRERKGER